MTESARSRAQRADRVAAAIVYAHPHHASVPAVLACPRCARTLHEALERRRRLDAAAVLNAQREGMP